MRPPSTLFTADQGGSYFANILNYDTDSQYNFENSLARISLGTYSSGTFTPYTPIYQFNGQKSILEQIAAGTEVAVQISFVYGRNNVQSLNVNFKVEKVITPAVPSASLLSGEISVANISGGALSVSLTAEAGMNIYSKESTWSTPQLCDSGNAFDSVQTRAICKQGQFYAENPATGVKSESLLLYYYWPTETLTFSENSVQRSLTLGSDGMALYKFRYVSSHRIRAAPCPCK